MASNEDELVPLEVSQIVESEMEFLVNKVGANPSPPQRALLAMRKLHLRLLTYLRAGRTAVASTPIPAQTTALVDYLHAFYLGMSTLGINVLGEEMCSQAVFDSHLLLPFLGPNEEGQFGAVQAGIPSGGAEQKCETLPVLSRVAGASLLSFIIYLTTSQDLSNIPPEDVSLLFSQMCVLSLHDEAIVANVAAELSAILAASSNENMPAFTIPQLHWLLLMARVELLEQRGNVHYALAQPDASPDKDEQNEHLRGYVEHMQAAHKTALQAIKALPERSYSYLRVAQLSAKMQQSKAAYMYIQRGIQMAERAQDLVLLPRMRLLHTALSILGGGGETFSLSAMQKAKQEALQDKEALREWVPERFYEHVEMEDGGERAILEKLLAAAEQRAGQGEAPQDALPAIQAEWIATGPRALPAGAFVMSK